jgi:hypothetical protein
MLTFRKRITAVFSGVFAAASIFACQAIAAGNGSPNTLAYYDRSSPARQDPGRTASSRGPIRRMHTIR